MNDDTDVVTQSIGAHRAGRRRPVFMAIGAVAAVAAIAVLAFALRDGDGSSTNKLTSLQLTSMQSVCRQWPASTASAPRGVPAGQGCASMVDWMSQQVRSGHMAGVRMWGTAAAMGASCRSWWAAGGGGASADSGQAWCDEMVSWMSDHIGNWPDWMAVGHMMGR